MSRIKKIWILFLKNFISPVKAFEARGGKIGTGCKIYKSVVFGSEPYLIKIGNNVRITEGVKFVTHDGGMWTLKKMGLRDDVGYFGTIEIGDNTHIGWNSIIMPNVKVGSNCVIGCCTVVTRDIPNNSVAVGIPAKVIKTIEEYNKEHIDKGDFTQNMSERERKEYLISKYMN